MGVTVPPGMLCLGKPMSLTYLSPAQLCQSAAQAAGMPSRAGEWGRPPPHCPLMWGPITQGAPLGYPAFVAVLTKSRPLNQQAESGRE